jgi:hypothetical protein
MISSWRKFRNIATRPQEYPVGRGEEIVREIHLPYGKVHGVKDFFIHLLTITIGLLIALSLDGLVEYQHHRHLAREAEDGLRAEIAHNAQEIGRQRQMIKDGQNKLETTLKSLAEMRAHPHAKRGPIYLLFGLGAFDDMAWKTAQNTGAITYMPYKDAQAFSNIYLEQEVYLRMVLLNAEDLGSADSLFISHPDDWVPSPAQIDMVTDRIGKVQFDLVILSSVVYTLDNTYQKFESEHK